MKPWVQLLSRGLRSLLASGFAFLLWTVWLGLALLFALQLYILSAHELALPGFALRQIEQQLAATGLRATFGRTSFDPTGRILIEDVRVLLPAFADPVLTARSAYVRLNLLALLAGRFEASELRLTNATAAVPATLTPSGRPEEIIRQLDATVEPAGRSLILQQLNARVAGMPVTVRGTLPLVRGSGRASQLALHDFLATRFPALCRQALALAASLAPADEPSLALELSPSESGALRIDVLALARGYRLDAPVAAQLSDLRVTTQLILFGETPSPRIEVSAGAITLPDATVVRGLHGRIFGRLNPGEARFDLRAVELTADALTVAGVPASGISAQIFPRPLPQVDAAIVARILGAPLTLRTSADLARRSATVRFEGEISPRVLDVVSRRVGTDVRRFYDFEALTVERGAARFGPGGKFEQLTARVHVPRMNSYGVIMEDGRATVELDPEHFGSPDAFARVGENFARGTYAHNLKTHQYRFLLEGRLRPLAISPWFKEWWPNFFRQLEFPGAPPDASVDVAGFWRDGRRSTVFVFADVGKSILRGTPFDHVRTRMFIRPGFFDGLEVLAARGDADAHGTFALISDPTTLEWQKFDLHLDSTLELKVAAELLGRTGAKIIEPFALASPPELKLAGSFAGPAAPRGTKDRLRIEARTTGDFRFHHFPVEDASFTVNLDGDEIVLDDIEATFAGGTVSGHARVWGTGAQRRLGFDVALQDSTLGQAATRLQEFFAAQKGQPPPPPGKFVQEKASVRLDLAASAEGRYDNPLSFRGDGNVALRGAEIGEVPLLGLLSELLKFTALRFTEARGNFKIDGARLLFPKVEIRGANSAIDAHGEYAMDRRNLDFNAKIFPFQESDNLLKSVVGAVLSPLSSAFEVKLTGSLEKPQWAFVIGPTNLLRALAEGAEGAKSPAGSPAATDAPPADKTRVPPPPPPGP